MENTTATQATPRQPNERKACIACGEMIPAHAVICSRCLQHQSPEKPDRMKGIMTWVGYLSAILGLLATLLGAVHWWTEHRQKRGGIRSEISIAEEQMQQQRYESAVQTYEDILARDPHNQRAASEDLKALMLWVENFSVSAPEGQDTSGDAAQKLDRIFSLLEAQQVRVRGTEQAADVLAHIGWAHFLNDKLAHRDGLRKARDNLKAALLAQPTNVYANAMLGNLLLQTGGDFHQALRYFAAALKTGNERPFVRQMQLGGLLGEDSGEGRAELVRVADQMRKAGEPLDDDFKARISRWVYDSVVGSHEQMTAVLSAVPPDEALATYDWLGDRNGGPEMQRILRAFLAANLAEIAGKRDEALAQFRAIQADLKDHNDVGFNFVYPVDEAVKRLSPPAPARRKARH